MDKTTLEARMRALEYFHTLRVLPGAWVVIRVDGRGFSPLTAAHFEKPFDPQFHKVMLQTAQTLFTEIQGVYAYTASDEISVLIPRNWNFFNRELEKLVSISAGIASAAFTHVSQMSAHSDSRVWLGINPGQIVEYFQWRQRDIARSALHDCCYWTLRQSGKSATEATALLENIPIAAKNEVLFQRGINFNDLPAWQRRGTGLVWETYQKSGYDPIRQQEVAASRRRIKIDEALPMKDGYTNYLQNVLNAPA